MCSIIGYVGAKNAAQVMLEGLERMEYRGYDSAGIAGLNNGEFILKKEVGRVRNLLDAIDDFSKFGNIGIGHTRWATHGGVSVKNAHPHISSSGSFVIVHNGVIENYEPIKKFLIKEGFTFYSETDTEVLANLIEYHFRKKASPENVFLSSVQRALMQVKGTYGIVVFTCKGFCIVSMKNEKVDAKNFSLDWDAEDTSLGEYDHFMMKEICEQPSSLRNAMRGHFSDDMSSAKFGGLQLSSVDLRQVDRILFCACGSAWHACLVAEYIIEKYARIPVEVEYASEFRYRNAPLDKNTLVFVISQSGETLDTISAMQEAKRKGFRTLAITNVVGSTIAREADGGIYQHSGPEIGVASTKSFTSQLCIAAMLALYLGRLRNMGFDDGAEFVRALLNVPKKVERILGDRSSIQKVAEKYANYDDMLFLGRKSMFPIALEGALKLKEISYIHAEGYPSAEMKHGPIALVSSKCPCFFMVTQKDILHKTISNIQEVKARGAPVIAVISKPCLIAAEYVDDSIVIPDSHDALLPILATVPLQLFAYYIAKCRGCDIDRPRNLAKSVTVE